MACRPTGRRRSLALAISMMLDPIVRSHLHGLVFAARRLVDGLHAGRHGSVRTGPGVEFYDYRAYCPGDEVSKIDWKLFGRTNRYYIRKHRQFTDLHVYLLVDCTASMDFAAINHGKGATSGSEPVTKIAYAKSLAAAIGYLTVRQHDRVGLGLCSNRLDHHTPPGGTWSHFQKICWTLEQANTASGPGDMSVGLRHTHSLMKRRGVIVLLSDLLEEPGPVLDAMKRLRHDRFEVIVFHLLTRSELDLGSLGDRRVKFVDAEIGHSVSTHVGQIRTRYRQLVTKHLTAIRQGCSRLGVDYSLVTTDRSAVLSLRRYLIRRAMLGGDTRRV